jgi:hypothetical protein
LAADKNKTINGFVVNKIAFALKAFRRRKIAKRRASDIYLAPLFVWRLPERRLAKRRKRLVELG